MRKLVAAEWHDMSEAPDPHHRVFWVAYRCEERSTSVPVITVLTNPGDEIPRGKSLNHGYTGVAYAWSYVDTPLKPPYPKAQQSGE